VFRFLVVHGRTPLFLKREKKISKRKKHQESKFLEMSLEKQIETYVDNYKNAKNELSKAARAKSQYLTQLSENEMVLKELELLTNESEVYKLIGPILIKQEPSEAKSNVSKRIEFIQNEIKRLDDLGADLEKKYEESRKKVIEIQAKLQQQQVQKK